MEALHALNFPVGRLWQLPPPISVYTENCVLRSETAGLKDDGTLYFKSDSLFVWFQVTLWKSLPGSNGALTGWKMHTLQSPSFSNYVNLGYLAG